jgi:hypothetical protein
LFFTFCFSLRIFDPEEQRHQREQADGRGKGEAGRKAFPETGKAFPEKPQTK